LLYDVERQATEQNLSVEETAALRSRLAYPILVRFEKWMVGEYRNAVEKSLIAEAIKYTYHRFDKLTRYHLDGR
jgi:transposase